MATAGLRSASPDRRRHRGDAIAVFWGVHAQKHGGRVHDDNNGPVYRVFPVDLAKVANLACGLRVNLRGELRVKEAASPVPVVLCQAVVGSYARRRASLGRRKLAICAVIGWWMHGSNIPCRDGRRLLWGG